jgi:hypothetical protein
MGHYYRFKRGDVVSIISGRYNGQQRILERAVFRRNVIRSGPMQAANSPGDALADLQGRLCRFSNNPLAWELPPCGVAKPLIQE